MSCAVLLGSDNFACWGRKSPLLCAVGELPTVNDKNPCTVRKFIDMELKGLYFCSGVAVETPSALEFWLHNENFSGLLLCLTFSNLFGCNWRLPFLRTA